jgi:hypothetical protein
LTRIYRKLEIHSRAELIRRVVDGEGGRDLVLETSRVGSRQSPHRSLDG